MPQDQPAAKYLRAGNHLARFLPSIDKWVVYKIHNTDENTENLTGKHVVTVDAVNLAIWKLGKTIPPTKDIKFCNLQTALEWIISDTGLTLINNSQSGLFTEMNFDGTSSSQSYLQQILTSFDCEANSYVVFDAAGLVSDIVLEIVDHVGSSEPNRTIRYGKNMMGVHRQTVDTTLITKLYIKGSGGGTIQSVNHGKDFITDPQANALYNTDINTWLEGTITSSSIKQPEALLQWGQRQLRLYNHPRVNYTVTASSDFKANLGDEVKIIDHEMKPVLTIQARVIQINESISNPYSNEIVLGEFSTVKVVTPTFIKSLESRWNDKIRDLFEKAKEGVLPCSVSLITPLGRSWYNDDTTKKVIARFFINGTNVTSYLSPSSFDWQFTNKDGTHNTMKEDIHKNDGYVVEIEPPFVGELTCSVNDDFIKNEAEIWIDTDKNNKDESFKQLWKSHYNKNRWGDSNYGALQCSYMKSDGTVLSSYAYKGNVSSHKEGKPNVVDTEFIHYDSNGDLLDSMILSGGGHGSSFSFNESDNQIYTVCQDIEGDNSWYVGALPYQPNAIVSINSFTWKCKLSKFVRPSFDFEHQYMMGSNMDGSVNVFKISDLKNNNYLPLIQMKLQDFDIKPSDSKGSVNGTTNTMQSNGIYYPYGFFTMGDVNNKDEKIILAVNLITHSQEFRFVVEEGQDIKLDVPLAQGGHLEPEGIYYDKSDNKLVVGFNISEWTDNTKTVIKPISATYAFYLGERDDSKDLATKYPIDESNIPLPTDNFYNPSSSDSDNEAENDIYTFSTSKDISEQIDNENNIADKVMANISQMDAEANKIAEATTASLIPKPPKSWYELKNAPKKKTKKKTKKKPKKKRK